MKKSMERGVQVQDWNDENPTLVELFDTLANEGIYDAKEHGIKIKLDAEIPVGEVWVINGASETVARLTSVAVEKKKAPVVKEKKEPKVATPKPTGETT